MTREEIIDGLEIYTVGRLNNARVHITVEELQKFIDAIKALGQETNEDCISRQGALEPYQTLDDNDVISIWMVRKNIEQMPTITPQPKTAQWISKGDIYPAWRYCSKCGEPWTFDCGTPDYCPVCGAKMDSEIKVKSSPIEG